MRSTLPITSSGESSTTVSPQWRHVIFGLILTILSMGMLVLEVYFRTPMCVGFWYGIFCFAPSVITFMNGFLVAKALTIVNLVTNSSCLLFGITVVAYLARLKSLPPFLFINTSIFLSALVIHTSLLVHELQWMAMMSRGRTLELNSERDTTPPPIMQLLLKIPEVTQAARPT